MEFKKIALKFKAGALDTGTAGTAEKLQALQAQLDELQKRCRARTISAAGIAQALQQVETSLDPLPYSYRAGIVAHCDINCQTFAKSYKGAPESTWFDAIRTSTGWTVTSIYRAYTAGRAGGCRLKIPETAAHELVLAHAVPRIF